MVVDHKVTKVELDARLVKLIREMRTETGAEREFKNLAFRAADGDQEAINALVEAAQNLMGEARERARIISIEIEELR